jgi:hypothetical protein
MATIPDLCYLCGAPLSGLFDREHVPPKQLYADRVRRENNLNLLTIPAHPSCNRDFQLDEDYFVNTLMPFARGTYAGDAIYSEILRKFRQGEKKRLVQRVLKEFELRPSGLVLPKGKILKRFDGARLQRVAWKIVRGLYFRHFDQVLPSSLTNGLRISFPDEEPPPDFFALAEEPTYGLYPGVFDYKFAKFPEIHNFHYWAMLLWDRLILITTFHDPECDCNACAARRAEVDGERLKRSHDN